MTKMLGTFELLVLLGVIALGDDAYGREVLRRLQSAMSGKQVVTAGAVYATLERLQHKRMLSSRVERGTPERGGMPKRYYKITPRGAAAAQQARAVFEQLWQNAPREATV